VPSRAWRRIFSRDQRCLNFSTGMHNISLSFWPPLWKINSFFAWGHLNFPYFTQLKFLLLTALIYIFLLTFWSHKTCYKSFAIPRTYTGYDGCPSRHRFPQAKLIFPLDLPTKHQPLSCSRSPWNSQSLANALCRFLGHEKRIIVKIEDGICNVSLRLVKRALLFPSGFLHYHHHDFRSHPHMHLSFTKKL